MSVPSDLQYTHDHQWVRREDDLATVGITAFAATSFEEAAAHAALAESDPS